MLAVTPPVAKVQCCNAMLQTMDQVSHLSIPPHLTSVRVPAGRRTHRSGGGRRRKRVRRGLGTRRASHRRCRRRGMRSEVENQHAISKRYVFETTCRPVSSVPKTKTPKPGRARASAAARPATLKPPPSPGSRSGRGPTSSRTACQINVRHEYQEMHSIS